MLGRHDRSGGHPERDRRQAEQVVRGAKITAN
jgi:hypothetical protein